jgi:DNA (cytosine-5)-methyltransferase 1
MSFRFIDLFAGIGGFHAAMSALGGRAVYASEIDSKASDTYLKNWNLQCAGDITLEANDLEMRVPNHDVLTGGFPCQPFSKSGFQRGMDETRGTLFWNIARIIEVQKPTFVLLENVRNLAGPRHTHEWEIIIKTLRDLGYRVSSIPFIISPHRIHPKFGGRPQVRERIYIGATFVGKGPLSQDEPEPLNLETVMDGWNPQNWNLKRDLPLEQNRPSIQKKHGLTAAETRWIDAWDDFVKTIRESEVDNSIPGFPIWADEWVKTSELVIPAGTPDWKANFLTKNAEFYTLHRTRLDKWKKRWGGLSDFPPSRRKFEWQAQDANSVWECIMHLRPSGIRVKKATYVPALVAITQTTIFGPQARRLTVRELARLQAFPETFSFFDQLDSLSYKQLGNAINVSAAYHALKALATRDASSLKGKDRKLADAILRAPLNPEFD